MSKMMRSMGSSQFLVWRLAMAAYFYFYGMALYPYVDELYSRQGLAHPIVLKELLLGIAEPDYLHIIGILPMIFSITLAFGLMRRFSCLVLYLVQLLFMNLNPVTLAPENGLLSWLLLMGMFAPKNEPYSLDRYFFLRNSKVDWKMPEIAIAYTWVIVALTYYFAGVGKLYSEDTAWLDGTGMYYILNESMLMRSWNRSVMADLSPWLFAPMTWGALFVECAGPLMLLTERLRKCWWILLFGMQIGLIFTMDLNQVVWALMLGNLFVFNPEWMSFLKKKAEGKNEATALSS